MGLNLGGLGRFYKSHEKKILAAGAALIGAAAGHVGVINAVKSIVEAVLGAK